MGDAIWSDHRSPQKSFSSGDTVLKASIQKRGNGWFSVDSRLTLGWGFFPQRDGECQQGTLFARASAPLPG